MSSPSSPAVDDVTIDDPGDATDGVTGIETGPAEVEELDTLGLDYRNRCLAAWHHTTVPADAVSDEWARLASWSQELLPS